MALGGVATCCKKVNAFDGQCSAGRQCTLAEQDHCRSMDSIIVRSVRQPAVSLVLMHSTLQLAASSTDYDPDRLAPMISTSVRYLPVSHCFLRINLY